MKKIILNLAICSSIFALSIDEVRELSIKNSNNLKALDETIESKISDKKERESTFYPSLNANYTIAKSNENTFVDNTDRDSLLNLTLSYNLFNGLRDKYNLELKELEIKTNRLNRDILTADTVFEAKKSFITLLQKIALKSVELEAVELLESQLKDSESFFENGLITKNELLEIKVELSIQKQKLLQANLDIRIATANLKKFIKQEINLNSLTEPTIRDINVNEKELLNRVFDVRSELKLMDLLKESKAYESKVVDSGYYPKVDVNLNYNRFGNEASLDNDEIATKLIMSWQLFDGNSKKHQNESLKYQKNKIDFDIKEIKDDLSLSLTKILSDITSSKEQLVVLKEAVDEAQENYKISLDRYKNSILTSTKLLDARVFLTRAKSDYIQEKYNLELLYIALDRLLEVK